MGSHNTGDDLFPAYKRGRGSGGHQVLSYAQVHIVDTELHDLPYDEARQIIQSLPFVETHSIRETSLDFWSGLTSRRLETIYQYLVAARVCQTSGLDWCLMMEEYTIVPMNFALKLKQFVTAPWQTYSHVHGKDGESSKEVLARSFSSISLFSSFNQDSNDPMMPHNIEYSQGRYMYDRAKLNSERYTLDLPAHHDTYQMKPVLKGDDGANAAMLFTNHVTTTQLIPMLEKLYEAERFKLTGDYSGKSVMSFDLEKELALYMEVPRFRTEPSLVNRIGLYDEYYPGSSDNRDSSYKQTIGITNWLTDPRFVFDAGRYWDDSVEYCLDTDSNWIYDPYFEDKNKSCCNPESDCANQRESEPEDSED